MKVGLVSTEGKAQGTVELNDFVFNAKESQGSVYHGIRNELANKRQGTAKTKVRSEVDYSSKKLWKQKGTGRARSGGRKSPIWVGGGTIFGPIPRDYSYTLPRKIKRLAFRSVLTEKVKSERLLVVQDFDIATKKTKDCYKILKALNPNQERSVLIVGDENQDIKQAARNIPWVRVYSYSRMLLKDLFYAKKVIVLQSVSEKLSSFYEDAKEEKQ